MRVYCSVCGEKARIGKTDRLSLDHANLYCSCTDPVCGHTFVANLSFSHTLSPSAKNTSELAMQLLKVLPAAERKKLQQELALN